MTTTLMPFARREGASALDQATFEEFYVRTSRQLWAYVYRVTGNPADTDDIVQETFCRFLRAGPLDRDEEQWRRYAFRIASNLAIDRARGRARDASTGEQTVAQTLTPPPSEEERDVSRIFEKLSTRERALLWLAYVEGHTHTEIAEALGVNRLSVRVLLFRARRHLRDLLAAGPVRRS